MLQQIKPKHKIKQPKRLGRGQAGHGKTCGRGHKGQKSRTGYKIPLRFEGGQTSLMQRLPKKRGFSSKNKKPVIVAYENLSKKFKTGETVSPATLLSKKIIKDLDLPVKILGPVKTNQQYIFKHCLMSKSVKKFLTSKI